ncbi:MAG: Rpn family recombination-promoting nuclease/putative transposase [Oligoflexia bacterium]|nr:Rpn family recombination-promoting nuclease/putative transposase [Oligoflexia bacterium]
MKKIFKKTKKPAFSHDRFFKAFFSDPKLAKELLLLAFSKAELKVFNLSKIKTEKDTFEGRGADLILSISF